MNNNSIYRLPEKLRINEDVFFSARSTWRYILDKALFFAEEVYEVGMCLSRIFYRCAQRAR